MKTITFFLVSVILFSFQASLAQQTQTHWLVGQWEGKIEGYLPKQNPARTLRVITVSSDGTAQARWAVTGQGMGGADIAVDGLKVTVVTSAKSQVELSREGDNLLVGTFILQTGRRFPIKLTKINGPTGQLKFEVSYASSRLALLSGEVKEALASFESQAQEAEKNAAASSFPQQYWKLASANYREASRTAFFSGQLQKSITYGERALQIAERIKDPIIQLWAIGQLIQAYRPVRNFDKARELIDKGFQIARGFSPGTNSRLGWESVFYSDLGLDFMRLREYEKAIEALSQSVYFHEQYLANLNAQRVSKVVLKAEQSTLIVWLIRLGNAYRQAGKLKQALEQYQHALNSIEEWGLKYAFMGDLYWNIGEVYRRQNNFSRALEQFKKALLVAEGQNMLSAIRYASVGIGDILRQTGKPDEAVPYYQKAIRQTESTRSLLESEDYRQSFFEGAIGVYVSMMRVLLSSGKPDEAFNYSERARSRTFLDILGSKVQLARSGTLLEYERALQARISVLRAMMEGEGADSSQTPQLRKELADAQRDYNEYLTKVRKENKEQASLMNVEPLTLKQVQELLDPGVTMLEYFVVNNNVWLWVVENDRVEFVRTSIARTDLVSKVTELRDTIYQFGEKERFGTLSQELHKLLIQPALPHIRGKELVIVPHDVLHYLPFQALLASDGRYLIEKYPIYYLSSASLMQFTKEKRRAKGDLSAVLAQAGKVLAFGNPDLGDPKMNLRFAELEAKEIQGLYPQSTVLLKKEATEDKGKTLSPQHDIIHFATHAELSEGDPLSSAILLARDDKEDGRLEVREIFGMNLKANLVVLSACETGLGKLSSGDELVGLTRAFIYAGTPSVVASLWNVEDSSTAALMASFYKNLRTMTKVEALRQAQLELIRGRASSDLLVRRGVGGIGRLGDVPETKRTSGDSLAVSTSHPYFWAPFILVGDGK